MLKMAASSVSDDAPLASSIGRQNTLLFVCFVV